MNAKSLKKITRQHTKKSSTVLRTKIIVLASIDMKYQDIAQKLDVLNNVITNWTSPLA